VADEWTCGMGLAEHSPLPAKLGEVADALAANLEVHMKALDLEDRNARTEHGAYLNLARRHRLVAAQLRAIGEEMAGYRDLPMGRHDEEAMSSPDVAEAFTRFVTAERELLALLQNRMEQDQRMLVEMGGAGGGAR
jgi:hypothetical protein